MLRVVRAGHIIAAALFAGFLAASPASAAEGPAAAVRSLAKGGFSAITETQQVVLRDAKVWEQFWRKHSPDPRTMEKMPKVDFEKEMVIAVTMGQQRTGGYLVEIASVEREDEKLKVTVRRRAPPPDSMTIQVVTSPYHFVAVPKSDLKAEFVQAKPEEKK
jgi:hypothetical protein